MSEEIAVVLVVGVIFAIFFYMAHRADQVVKEKARKRLEEAKSVVKSNPKKDSKKAG
jgi:preprotein translocase subunit YajC